MERLQLSTTPMLAFAKLNQPTGPNTARRKKMIPPTLVAAATDDDELPAVVRRVVE